MLYQNLKEVLIGLERELPGFIAVAVVDSDGLNIAQHARSSQSQVEKISAQMALFVKLVETSVFKLEAGVIEDTLLTTEDTYLLIWIVPDAPYFLGVVVDRHKTLLGHLRLLGRVYVKRIAHLIANPESVGDFNEQSTRVTA